MPYRRWLSLAVLVLCLAGCGMRPVSAAAPRNLTGTFRSGSTDRTYTMHLPPGDPVGLVLSLHGGGGTGNGQRGLTDFDAVADAHNLLVVYPDGYGKSWADGRGASPADRRHIDDVGRPSCRTTTTSRPATSSLPECPTAASCPTDLPATARTCSRRSRRWQAPWVWAWPAIRRGRFRSGRRTAPPIRWCPTTAEPCTVPGRSDLAAVTQRRRRHRGASVRLHRMRGVHRSGLLPDRERRAHLAGRQAIPPQGDHRAHHACAGRLGVHCTVFPGAHARLGCKKIRKCDAIEAQCFRVFFGLVNAMFQKFSHDRQCEMSWSS